MWHASAASISRIRQQSESILRSAALRALDGVGDAKLGEWLEWSGYAYHIRRRLTALEAVHIGEVIDIRGTAEAERRRQVVLPFLPIQMRDYKE